MTLRGTSLAVLVLNLWALTSAAQTTTQPLGWLSKQYEVGNGGPGTVSTGQGDAGGASYGSYQMTSQYTDSKGKVHVGGTVQSFVNKHYATEFQGLTPGSKEFTAKWKELAKADPTGFDKAQHDYIQATHYDVTAAGLKGDGLNVGKRSAALQNVVWSTSVQHGGKGGESLIEKALAKQIKDGTVGSMSDEDIIKAIYAERGRKDKDGNLVHFGKNSKKVQDAVAERFVSEQANALKALGDEQKAPKSPDDKKTSDGTKNDGTKNDGTTTPGTTPTKTTAGDEGHHKLYVDGKFVTKVPPAEVSLATEKYTKFYKGKSVSLKGPFYSVKAVRDSVKGAKDFVDGVLPAPAAGAVNAIIDAAVDGTAPGASLLFGDKVSAEFRQKVRDIAKDLGVSPDDLMVLMALETNGKFEPGKYPSSGAVGLIQFTPTGVADLGTTVDDLAKLTALEQLDWVKKYFELQTKRYGKMTSADDLYCAIFAPVAVGKAGDFVTYQKGKVPDRYTPNKSLDTNNDGNITRDEITARVREWYARGQGAWVDLGPANKE